MYQCKNTQGSFRCVPKRCEDNQVLDPGTGECKSVNCPPGYRPRDGRCEDVDECREKAIACPIYEECELKCYFGLWLLPENDIRC
ncbi:unnamed protein product [Meloidogyne enterolobii]|uniref:Uncharacterized protein n=1 Tax=Meloidogyne enterolobii TaxID=390850 RepID=A0ACB0Y3Q4_MELEN